MAEMKRSASVCVIGDLVGSRRAADRAAVHRRLTAGLTAVNERWGSDLRVIAGDEFQGTAPTLGAAATLTLALRLWLLPDVDARFGIGRGTVALLAEDDGIQDGPGWWAARAAIDGVAAWESAAPTRSARTAFRSADPADPADPVEAAFGAALLARDALVGRLDPRALSVLRGLLEGRSQREIARELGVSASAVSQRVRHDGLGVVLAVTEMLGGAG